MKNNISSIILLAFFCCSSVAVMNAQTPLDEAVRRADVMPAWPDCDPILPECTKSRMADFIAANLQIPMEAKAENAGGLVMMEFVIEKNGTVGEIKPVVDPGLGLGAEATRVIALMQTKKIKWSPAKIDGKKVAYRYTVPISFNLNTPAKDVTATSTMSIQADPAKVYDVVDIMPKYAGCGEAEKEDDCTFSKVVAHINTNLKYPQEAIEKKVSGQAIVEFVVDTNGEVINPKIVKSLGAGCDEEVIRVIELMPAWNPGQLAGVPVKVKMNLPVMFQLPKEKEE
jgi:protein TonB